MVINIESFHSSLEYFLEERGILDVGLLKRGLNNPSRNRKHKMILKLSILRGKMDSTDVGRGHLDCRMRKGVCGEKVFEFMIIIHA
jgi:hypothetical protein